MTYATRFSRRPRPRRSRPRRAAARIRSAACGTASRSCASTRSTRATRSPPPRPRTSLPSTTTTARASTCTGAGFLGFGTVRQWEPDRGAETVTTYDNATLDDSVLPSVYPDAGQPRRVRRAVVLPGPEPRARIAQIDFAYQLERTNKGQTWFVHPSAWASFEWEQAVSVASGAAAEHITGIDAASAATPSGVRDGTYTYDAYGNLLDARVHTTDGVTDRDRHDLRGAPGDVARSGSSRAGACTPRPRAGHGDGAAAHGLHVRRARLPLPRVRGPGRRRPVDASRRSPTRTTATGSRARSRPPRGGPADADDAPRVRHGRARLPHGDLERSRARGVVGPRPGARRARGERGRERRDGRRTSTTISAGCSRARPRAAARRSSTTRRGSTRSRGDVLGTSVHVTRDSGAEARTDTDALGRAVGGGHLGFDGTWIEAARRYDVLGRVVAVQRPGLGAPASAATTYAYDGLDRLDAGDLAGPEGHDDRLDLLLDHDDRSARPPAARRARPRRSRDRERRASRRRASVATAYGYGDFDQLESHDRRRRQRGPRPVRPARPAHAGRRSRRGCTGPSRTTASAISSRAASTGPSPRPTRSTRWAA